MTTSMIEPFSKSTSILENDFRICVALVWTVVLALFTTFDFGLSMSDLEGDRLSWLSESELVLELELEEETRETAASISFWKTDRTLKMTGIIPWTGQ